MAKRLLRSLKNEDLPCSFKYLQSKTKTKLDKRKSYCLIMDVVHGYVTFSQPCSGCTEEFDHHKGSGCDECGYQGRVRVSHWVPIDMEESILDLQTTL